MKFCSHCGAQCKDSALFCTTCGQKLGETPPQQNVPPPPNVPPQQQVPPQPNPAPPPYGVPPQPNMPAYGVPPRPVASAVRTPLLQMMESPAPMAAAILLSASILLTFISVCMSNWMSVFSMSVSILGAVGLWMLVASAQEAKTRGRPMSLSSFPLFKVCMILAIVADGIYLLIVDIRLIIAMASLGRYYLGWVLAVLLASFLLITAYVVLAILYYVQGLRVVSDIRLSLEMGQQPRPFSRYFIVVSFILGIGGALGGIAMLILSCLMRELFYGFPIAPAVLAFLATLASAGFYIVIGVCLSRLNRSFAYQHTVFQQQNRMP